MKRILFIILYPVTAPVWNNGSPMMYFFCSYLNIIIIKNQFQVLVNPKDIINEIFCYSLDDLLFVLFCQVRTARSDYWLLITKNKIYYPKIYKQFLFLFLLFICTHQILHPVNFVSFFFHFQHDLVMFLYHFHGLDSSC